MKTYIEKVNWNNLARDWNDGDNDGYVYGINYVDFENAGDIIDCEWYRTEEEREKAILELGNVTILNDL
jgi:hypothetical protein